MEPLLPILKKFQKVQSLEDFEALFYDDEARGFGYRLCHCGGQIGGNHIWIQHADGYVSRYYHLRSANVSEGQQVSQGQVIGIKGNTGASTGEHLHFELWRNGTKLNPTSYIGF